MAKSQKKSQSAKGSREPSASPSIDTAESAQDMVQRFSEEAKVKMADVQATLDKVDEQFDVEVPKHEEYIRDIVAFVKAEKEARQITLAAARMAEARSNALLCSEVLSKSYSKDGEPSRRKKIELGLDAAANLFERELNLLNG